MNLLKLAVGEMTIAQGTLGSAARLKQTVEGITSLSLRLQGKDTAVHWTRKTLCRFDVWIGKPMAPSFVCTIDERDARVDWFIEHHDGALYLLTKRQRDSIDGGAWSSVSRSYPCWGSPEKNASVRTIHMTGAVTVLSYSDIDDGKISPDLHAAAVRKTEENLLVKGDMSNREWRAAMELLRYKYQNA